MKTIKITVNRENYNYGKVSDKTSLELDIAILKEKMSLIEELLEIEFETEITKYERW